MSGIIEYTGRGESTLIPGAARRRRSDADVVEKLGYPHFILKEIHEQPEAVLATLCDRLDMEKADAWLPELCLKDHELIGLTRLLFVACGPSWHAALAGKYLVESFARLPVDVEIASEFLDRPAVLDARVLTVAISHSGESPDTVAALRAARRNGSLGVAISEMAESRLVREADGVVYTRAGAERGVSSTKAFTAQLAAVTLLALRLGVARRMLATNQARAILHALRETPSMMEQVLEDDDVTRGAAAWFRDRRHFIHLGRSLHYPIALEGALKFKEMACVHAEGYAGGEMKHGPLALVCPGLPVVAVAPSGPNQAKMAGNIHEVKARGGIVIAVADPGSEAATLADVVLPVPSAPFWVQPMLTILPLQLVAYHLGVLRGCPVDTRST
ncbi:MAG: SIS domain-containing protein [Candidatus Polarisedimenticolia bacterium]